jgi:hypothetical protein
VRMTSRGSAGSSGLHPRMDALVRAHAYPSAPAQGPSRKSMPHPTDFGLDLPAETRRVVADASCELCAVRESELTFRLPHR